MRTALFSVVTQRVVVIYYRRFGTTCRSHLRGSRIPCMNYGNQTRQTQCDSSQMEKQQNKQQQQTTIQIT